MPLGAIADTFAKQPNICPSLDIDDNTVELQRPRCRRTCHRDDRFVDDLRPALSAARDCQDKPANDQRPNRIDPHLVLLIHAKVVLYQ